MIRDYVTFFGTVVFALSLKYLKDITFCSGFSNVTTCLFLSPLAIIGVSGTPYESGVFKLDVSISDRYVVSFCFIHYLKVSAGIIF